MWSKLAGPSSPNLAVNATCTSGQLFGSSAVAYSFGQMLDVRNVVLQKCAWNAAHNKCMDSVGLAHEDARQVAKLRSLITSCETTWFPQTGQHRTVPTGHHGNAVKAVQLSQAAAAAESPDEIAFLIDAFGMTVIGHANLDVLFPLATTVRALFRSESFLDCKQRGGQCRVFLVNGAEQSNSPNGRHHSAVSSYNREMQTLILGRPFERADAIPLRRYARVVVGFLSEAQPVMWPHIYLNHITHRPNQHRLWNDFHATLRAELGLLRAIGSYGVWLRREPSAARDLGARRNLNDGEWATVQAHACASSVDGGARRSRGDSSGGAKAMGALGGSDCWLHELHLHKLAFHEQARAMQGARLIGSFEGSSFVNQLFMPPGGTLLMIDTQKRKRREKASPQSPSCPFPRPAPPSHLTPETSPLKLLP